MSARRIPLVLAAVTVLASVVASVLAPAQGVGSTAAARADTTTRRDRPLLGTAVADKALTGDRPYRRMLRERYRKVTPENVMKWSEIHPERDRYDFTASDRLVRFARRHGQSVHGHTLAWHQQNPEWLTTGAFTRDELIDILEDHIRTVVRRYRGRVANWDVVNEAVDETGEMRRTLWFDGIGPDYVDIAFRAAHRADPKARLFYNDYGAEVAGPKRTGVLGLVRGLVDRGVPVDGVGLQMHTTSSSPPPEGDPPLGAQFFRPDPEKLADTLATYDAMDLEVAVTEMDVRLPLPADASALAIQADVYRDVWRTCIRAPNCSALTTWGFTDRYSWVPSFFTGYGAALPYDEELRPKPAARVLRTPRSVR